MNKYIIYTTQGDCKSPDGKYIGNCQVLGVASGMTGGDAIKNLFQESELIRERGYEEPGCVAMCLGAESNGYRSIACNTEFHKGAESRHERCIAANTGSYSAAVCQGAFSTAVNVGDEAVAASLKDYSVAIATGQHTTARSEGKKSVAIATGRMGSASGELGNWLVLVERDIRLNILGVQAVQVDGVTILPGKTYWLKDGTVQETKFINGPLR